MLVFLQSLPLTGLLQCRKPALPSFSMEVTMRDDEFKDAVRELLLKLPDHRVKDKNERPSLQECEKKWKLEKRAE